MSTNPPETTDAAPALAVARRGFVRRMLAAQESGLIIVIAAMMLGLTLFGGTKPKLERVTLDPGAEVVEIAPDGTEYAVGTYPDQSRRTVEIRTDGRVVKRYTNAIKRWRVTESAAVGDEVDAAAEPVRTLSGRLKINKFLERDNLFLVASNTSFIAVIAVGMTAVIITAGIDLSVGAIYALTAVLGSMVLRWFDPGTSVLLTVPVAVLICSTIGALLGAGNGIMIVGFKLHPFIITLGTMSVYRGFAFLSTRGQTISGLPNSLQQSFFKYSLPDQVPLIGGVEPALAAIMMLVVVAGSAVLVRTVFGRRVYAIGGNPTAARYAGIPVGRVVLLVYALTGALAGLAACMYLGYYGAATSGAGSGLELRVIAAAVVGGASLTGGRGTAFGALLGAIIIELINNGISIFGIDNNYLAAVTGAAIIVAAVIDRMKQGLEARSGGAH